MSTERSLYFVEGEGGSVEIQVDRGMRKWDMLDEIEDALLHYAVVDVVWMGPKRTPGGGVEQQEKGRWRLKDAVGG